VPIIRVRRTPAPSDVGWPETTLATLRAGMTYLRPPTIPPGMALGNVVAVHCADVATSARFRLEVRDDEVQFRARMIADIRDGLTARPRRLPPKYFYDEVGCRLFERITELPEYYLTRAERSILETIAGPLLARLRPRDLVELGPGSCEKARLLLDALPPGDSLRYVAVDVGREGLTQAATRLADEYPSIEVHALVADFEHHLVHVPPPSGRRLVLFLGSTIGNLDPLARHDFLGELRGLLGPDGRLLLGVDLVKDRRTLEAAYDDPAGVTAAFNRNVLRHVNHLVDGDFVPEHYRHHAFYNVEASRIEMHLVAQHWQHVELRGLPLALDLAEGDDIWTENSYKFTREGTEAELAGAGLGLEQWCTDAEQRFGLVLCRPLSGG
jgi:L-histidine Nalpha-methyltransferase